MKFKVDNIHCKKCVARINKVLGKEFGEIKVDLNKEPRILDVNLEENKKEIFCKKLEDIGFEVIK